MFIFLQKTLAPLRSISAELFLNLALQLAVTADLCESVSKQNGNEKTIFNPVTYEFVTQAFLSYESEISDSNSQKSAITSIVGTLLSLKSVDAVDYEALITKTTQYAARLLKKTDQCKMILLCSHLFFTGEKEVSSH